jgi:5-methylcytosine-specific restriction endonuclease McrA
MRHEFTKRVKFDAWLRCNGFCETCNARLRPGRYRYDHRTPDTFGGTATLDNIQVICSACDNEKTYKSDIPAIAKNNRVRNKHLGIGKRKRTIPGRTFSGQPIPSRWK